MQAFIRAAQIRLACPDLDASLRFYTERLGLRIELVMPADAPSLAVVSGHGLSLRLVSGEPSPAPAVLHLLCDMKTLPAGMARELTAPEGTRISLAEASPPVELPPMQQEFVLVRLGDEDGGWDLGRAGMAYRDLIPGRLGGRFVASQIRIREGGPVPDWVHFHRIRFQMIYCLKGWARLVYEDQGGPFLLNEGDCVLQPPEIRHRVLESSSGLEVVEIGSPAVHETFADHALDLPNAAHRPDRRFGGQRFARHIAASAVWSPWRLDAYEARDTGIAAATDGLASVRVVRPIAGRHGSGPVAIHQGEFLFFFVLKGALGLESSVFGSHRLASGDCCVIPAGAAYALTSEPGLEMLEVMLPEG